MTKMKKKVQYLLKFSEMAVLKKKQSLYFQSIDLIKRLEVGILQLGLKSVLFFMFQ